MPRSSLVEQLKARHRSRIAVENQVLFIPALGLVYRAISKNACSLVKSELYRMANGAPRPPNRSPHNRKAMGFLGPGDVDEATMVDWLYSKRIPKIAFLRDPLARLKSCFQNRVHGLGLEPYDNRHSSHLNLVRRRQVLLSRRGLQRAGFRTALATPLDFDAFIDAIGRQHPWEMDEHWAPQSLLLARDWIDYDFLGRVERLAQDLPRVAQLVDGAKDYTFTDTRLNATPRERRDALEVSEQTAARVREIYADDYALLASLEQDGAP